MIIILYIYNIQDEHLELSAIACRIFLNLFQCELKRSPHADCECLKADQRTRGLVRRSAVNTSMNQALSNVIRRTISSVYIKFFNSYWKMNINSWS